MGGLSRRQAFAGFGSVSLGALLGACSGDDDSAVAGHTDTSRLENAARCTRTAEETEGPFYATDPLYERDLELTLSRERDAYVGLITLDVERA